VYFCIENYIKQKKLHYYEQLDHSLLDNEEESLQDLEYEAFRNFDGIYYYSTEKNNLRLVNNEELQQIFPNLSII
jgi:hypothetical protein